MVPMPGEDKSLAWSWAWGSSPRHCFAEDCCISGIVASGGSLLLIQYVGTAVLEVAFCCWGLVCFKTSPLVQLLQIFLQPNETDPSFSLATRALRRLRGQQPRNG